MVSQKEALRGKERIQQLMEAFPEVPRTLVINTDLYREGIRPTEAARQIGSWAHPYAPWYFEYSKEYIYRPEEIAEGYFLVPLFGYFSNGVSWVFMWDSKSPYEVRYEERGRYRLYRDGEPIEEVFFPPRPHWYDRKTSSGKPMPSVISARGEDSLMLVPLSFCEYFNDDRGCRYCNINPSESTRKDLGIERLTAKREQDIYETLVAAAQKSDIRRMTMSGGVILDSGKEADMYARIIKTLKRAMKDVGHEVPILVKCQAVEEEDIRKLQEAGVNELGFNLEVWDPKLFEWLCPGKAKFVGRERWLDRLLKAVEVLGKGRVSTSLVVGLELAQPYGFKTEDEAAASYLEGIEWVLDHGVTAQGQNWRPAPGTIFEGQPSPRTEYFLRIQAARGKMLAEYPWTGTPATRVDPQKETSADRPSPSSKGEKPC